ncbi:PorT family protein [Marinoscillum pacificum]|uniref:PorT family protein n=1 Tax=Marinoscillum pacificum TaxID=392723 RepID=UPI002157E6E6|nr:PorT family protein [Marinoscillum pacificum]
MKFLLKSLFVITFGILSLSASAQFWFGPKGGINRNDFIYQSESYLDTFTVNPTYSFEIGGTMIYQANDMFSVQTELYYEREKRNVSGKQEVGVGSTSQTKNSFLSAPALFRVSLDYGATHYYVSGGPKVQMWLGGKGEIVDGDGEFVEPEKVWDRLVFKQSKSNTAGGVYAVPEGNRIQYALVAGGGVYFDLYFGGRLLIDCKYTFGHSNMGFNDNQDFKFIDYTENFRYRSNTLSITMAYLFEYDMKGAKKGMSTIKASNKKKKK